MSQMAKVFGAKWQGSTGAGRHLGGRTGAADHLGVLPHDRRYFLSAIFGALLLAVTDPGGKYAYRVARMAVFALAGALLTVLGFGIGPGAWGWVVLAAFVATLLGGLTVKYGVHRFVRRICSTSGSSSPWACRLSLPSTIRACTGPA